MMYWYGTGAGTTGWGYLFMVFGMLLPWVVVIVGGMWLGRHLTRTGQRGVQQPEQVLAGRFARGELDEDEYRHQLVVLRGDMHAGG